MQQHFIVLALAFFKFGDTFAATALNSVSSPVIAGHQFQLIQSNSPSWHPARRAAVNLSDVDWSLVFSAAISETPGCVAVRIET
eukprot:m.212426 g.212426  ORF g.212426 m.212426 type:complete len:84 (+) comp25530_c0_seq1:535-786(+)